MSESNNNTPMRITQLQEATAYEEGMYYAVAKAGSGTKKISCGLINNAISESNIKNEIDYSTIQEGYFISRAGVKSSNSSYGMLEFSVKQNDKVIVTTKSSNTYVAVIAEKQDTYYQPIVIADTNDLKTYIYEFSKDSIATISVKKSDAYSVYIIHDVITPSDNLNYKNVFFVEGDTDGYYSINTAADAIVLNSSTTFKCKKIEVESWMKTISCIVGSASSLNNKSVLFGFTDENDRYIYKASLTSGEQTAPIPQNAKYIYLSFFGYQYCDSYIINIDNMKFNAKNPYNGLKGVSFGTSLTYRQKTTGGYLDYLPYLSGISIDNQGVGSSYIYGASGSLNMLEKIKSYTEYEDKDIITIEGFINDWWGSHVLGEYTATTETSVCGCVRSALNHVRSQNANSTIFLILDHYGQLYNGMDCSSSAKKNNLTQYEYYQEISKVAESLGIIVIKQYAESQIGEYTPQYFVDNIHLNILGGKQSAYFIWQKIKSYIPIQK